MTDIKQEILALIARGVAKPTSDDEFNALASRLFAHQFERCEVYRRYCEKVGCSPKNVTQWTEIPAVPTAAFKEFDIATFPIEQARAVFHTSGTTKSRAGRHFLLSTDVYDAAILPNFAAALLPDGAKLPIFVLTPSPKDAPHSSLSHMMGVVVREFGAPNSEFFIKNGELLADKLCAALQKNQPVMLLGAAFSFVHFFEHCEREKFFAKLPDGSRAMETGGFKGRAREISSGELYAMFEKFLGIPAEKIVNEYGMTELSSQFYGAPDKNSPPWTRVQIIDPQTGREAAEGNRGLIRIFDLANVYSVVAIQTEDIGIAIGDKFRVLGRATGAEARGCSIAMDELLNA
jgi:phenylacetate-coenzyme A ligase PaaK-like adenylate-forming protein